MTRANLDDFEEITKGLGELQLQVGDLSMQIADLTLQIEQLTPPTNGQDEQQIILWQQQLESLESEMTDKQSQVRELMVKMEKMARGEN